MCFPKRSDVNHCRYRLSWAAFAKSNQAGVVDCPRISNAQVRLTFCSCCNSPVLLWSCSEQNTYCFAAASAWKRAIVAILSPPPPLPSPPISSSSSSLWYFYPFDAIVVEQFEAAAVFWFVARCLASNLRWENPHHGIIIRYWRVGSSSTVNPPCWVAKKKRNKKEPHPYSSVTYNSYPGSVKNRKIVFKKKKIIIIGMSVETRCQLKPPRGHPS
jgi:hypothetical protein